MLYLPLMALIFADLINFLTIVISEEALISLPVYLFGSCSLSMFIVYILGLILIPSMNQSDFSPGHFKSASQYSGLTKTAHCVHYFVDFVFAFFDSNSLALSCRVFKTCKHDGQTILQNSIEHTRINNVWMLVCYCSTTTICWTWQVNLYHISR